MKYTCIFLAQGFEPLEALAPMDILKRGKTNAIFVSVNQERIVKSTQGYGICADMTWEEFRTSVAAEQIECMIFPGGLPGADNLGEHGELMSLMKSHYADGRLTCAICAAPARVLAANLGNILSGCSMTAYEGFEAELEAAGAISTAEGVSTCGHMITAKGPGLAMDFGFAILSALKSPEVTDLVKKGMML